MEKKKLPVCHETGVIIIIGMIISVILELADHKTAEKLDFSNTVFFDVLLPLIIFATGYNMRRKNFFENIVNISKFGILGTVLTFVFYSIFFLILFKGIGLTFNNPKEYTDPETGIKVAADTYAFEMDSIQIIYICSILCSSDIIAAVTLVKFEDQPKLFSTILGEGLFNDAVAIILFQTM